MVNSLSASSWRNHTGLGRTALRRAAQFGSLDKSCWPIGSQAGCLAQASAPKAFRWGRLMTWPLFGAMDQRLAGLTPLVISVMLVKLAPPCGTLCCPSLLITVRIELTTVLPVVHVTH